MYGHMRSQSAGQLPLTFPAAPGLPSTPQVQVAGAQVPPPPLLQSQQSLPLLAYTPVPDAAAQQAAYLQHAAAAGYSAGQADWSQQQQQAAAAAQQAQQYQQYQQQLLLSSGGAAVPAGSYDWSTAYALPPKEPDAGGTVPAASAEQQQQQQQMAAQQYGEMYAAYASQEAYRAQAAAMQQQQQQQPQPSPTQPTFVDAYGQPTDAQAYQQAQAYAAAAAAAATPSMLPHAQAGYGYGEYPVAAGMPSLVQPMMQYAASAPTTPLAGTTGSLAGASWFAHTPPHMLSPSKQSQLQKGFGSTGHGAEPGPRERRERHIEGALDKDPLTYKTEVCRTHLSTGHCDYGATCQFAHGVMELRSREFDSKYKTELCKNYYLFGHASCFFASRCKFIHDEYRIRASEFEFWLVSPAENLVRVEIVDPRNTQRLEQLTALVNNPPKPPVSPLRPTERTLFQAQLEEEKVKTDNLIAPDPLAPAQAVATVAEGETAAGEEVCAEVPLIQLPASVAEEEQEEEEALTKALGSVELSSRPSEPASRPPTETASAPPPSSQLSPNASCNSRTSHSSPNSSHMVMSPRSPVARVRLEEQLPPSTLPPLTAVAVAGLLSPRASPSHHSIENRRARLLELAMPTEGAKEAEQQKQQEEVQEQEQGRQGGGAQQQEGAGSKSEAGASPLEPGSAAATVASGVEETKQGQVTRQDLSLASTTNGGRGSPGRPGASAFQRVSPQDVRVRDNDTNSRGYRREEFARRRSSRSWSARADPSVGTFPQFPSAYPAATHLVQPMIPHPVQATAPAYIPLPASYLHPSTMSMQPATMSFAMPLMSNAPIAVSFGTGGEAMVQRRPPRYAQGQHSPRHQQQPQQQSQQSSTSAGSDVRTLTGIIPLEPSYAAVVGGAPVTASPIQRVPHPPPGASSSGPPHRSLQDAAFSGTTSVGVTSTLQLSPKPFWLEQQSRALNLPVFEPPEEPASEPSDGKSEQQHEQQPPPPPEPQAKPPPPRTTDGELQAPQPKSSPTPIISNEPLLYNERHVEPPNQPDQPESAHLD